MRLTSERAQGDPDFGLGVGVHKVGVLTCPALLLVHELGAELLVRVALQRERLVETEHLEEVREVVLVLRRHLLVPEKLGTEVEARVGLDELLQGLLLALDEARSVRVRRTEPDFAVRLLLLDAAVLVDLGLKRRRLERILRGPGLHTVPTVGERLEVRLELDDRRAVRVRLRGHGEKVDRWSWKARFPRLRLALGKVKGSLNCVVCWRYKQNKRESKRRRR